MYYFVRVRPFEPTLAKADLTAIIRERQLGSIRVFPIFGPYDLLIRTWSYPTVATRVSDYLDAGLRGFRDLEYFSVTHIYHCWYSKTFRRREQRRIPPLGGQQAAAEPVLLETLDEKTIRAVESGAAHEMESALIAADLLIDRPAPRRTIRFFVPIRFAENTPAIVSTAVRDLAEYFQSHSDQVASWSLYGGYGFCSLLVAGAVAADRYEDVALLPNWVGEHFQDFGASTETYLAHGYDHLIVETKIAESTFREIKGKDLFVQTVIPELYEVRRDKKVEEVEQFLKTQVEGKLLTTQDRSLLHDALLAYLRNSPSEMVKTLLIFFIDIESFLRDSLNEFIGRLIQEDPVRFLEKAGIAREKGRFLTMGDLLKAYSLALNSNGQDRVQRLDIAAFVRSRNLIAHEGVNALVQWREILGGVVESLVGVREILSAVQDVTKRPFVGTY